jgi:hypothetical protein
MTARRGQTIARATTARLGAMTARAMTARATGRPAAR